MQKNVISCFILFFMFYFLVVTDSLFIQQSLLCFPVLTSFSNSRFIRNFSKLKLCSLPSKIKFYLCFWLYLNCMYFGYHCAWLQSVFTEHVSAWVHSGEVIIPLDPCLRLSQECKSSNLLIFWQFWSPPPLVLRLSNYIVTENERINKLYIVTKVLPK